MPLFRTNALTAVLLSALGRSSLHPSSLCQVRFACFWKSRVLKMHTSSFFLIAPPMMNAIKRERFDAASVVWSRRHLTWGSCRRDGRRDLLGHRRRASKRRSCPRHTREDDGSGGTLSKQTEHPAAALLLLCCFSSLLLCSAALVVSLLCRDVVSGAVDR